MSDTRDGLRWHPDAWLGPAAFVLTITGLACGRTHESVPEPSLITAGPPSIQLAADTSPLCKSCRVSLDTIARIQSSDSATFFLSTKIAYSAGLDRFYAAPLVEEGRIAEFDGAGRFLRLIGRVGDGPGESRRIRHLVSGPGDSLLIVGSDFRLVWLALSTGQTTDGRLPPGVVPDDVLVLPGGEIVVNSSTPTARSLVLMGSDFMPKQPAFGDSVGAKSRQDSPDSAARLSARLGHGGTAGSFIEATQKYGLRLRVWDTRGGLQSAWELQRDWYPPYSVLDETDRGRGLLPSQARPLPVVTGAWLEGDLAWVVVAIPDPNWQQDDPVQPEEPLLKVSTNGIATLAVRDWSRYYDGIIEAVELTSGKTYVRTRFPKEISRSLGSGLVVQGSRDSLGDYVHTVSRVWIQR